MKGKEKCNLLKEVREKIARENGIPWSTRECSHEGDCTGTCPYCEGELKKLEREIRKRRLLGKSIMLGGIASGLVAGLTGCSLFDHIDRTPDPLEGDVAISSVSPEEVWMGEEEYVPDEDGDDICSFSDDTELIEGELEPYTDYESEESYILDGDVIEYSEEEANE